MRVGGAPNVSVSREWFHYDLLWLSVDLLEASARAFLVPASAPFPLVSHVVHSDPKLQFSSSMQHPNLSRAYRAIHGAPPRPRRPSERSLLDLTSPRSRLDLLGTHDARTNHGTTLTRWCFSFLLLGFVCLACRSWASPPCTSRCAPPVATRPRPPAPAHSRPSALLLAQE